MTIELRVLEAAHGDCIWLRYGQSQSYTNIIIDSGPVTFYKGFSDLINRIKAKGESVDLLIITHIDNDHLGGFSRWIENKDSDTSVIKKIWFNTGTHIKKHLNNPAFNDKEYIVCFNGSNSQYNVQMGMDASQHLVKRGVNLEPIIIAGYQESLNGAEIKVLSPSKMNLEKLLEKWEAYSGDISYSSPSSYAENLSDLMGNDKFDPDPSSYNGSSIAFTFSYEGKVIAFLGDAHASTIVETIGSNPLNVVAMKLSHHGSSANTNDKLLEAIKTNNYIVSTNGSRNNPDKKTIARILQANSEENVCLFSNYDWWSNRGIFTQTDFDEYITTEKLRKIKLSEDLIPIVKGVVIGNA